MGKASREQSARERLQEQRRRQQARGRLMRRFYIGGAAVLVIALVVGIGFFVQSQRATGDGEFSGNLPPVTQLDDGGIEVAKQGVNKPTLEIYEDFQCPICKRFEETNGAMVKRLAAEGKLRVVYRTVSFVRVSQSDTRTIRANNAAMCAADQNAFMPYHDKLFEEQPPESPPQGFTTEDLKAWGKDVGIQGQSYDKFVQCVESKKHKDEIMQRTQQALNGKVSGTPTLFLGGQKLSNQVALSPSALEQAILDAQ